MMRRPARLADATMHQPACVVWPVLMPSAPGYVREQVVGRRDRLAVERGALLAGRRLEGLVAHEVRAEADHVVGGRVLAVGVEAGHVDGVGVGEPEGGGVGVHQLGEGRLAAGDVDGEGAGGVVGADDEHRPSQRVALQLLAGDRRR